MATPKTTIPLTGYQKIVIALLAAVQFTIVLDFMVMAPLGDMLMKSMHMHTNQFASAVSAYAFSAGFSGFMAAGFADKYDRKKLLILFYSGFIIGTFLCGVASSYHLLLFGRIVTGLFGGVLGSVSMAIIADLFAFEQRGRVMGFVQMSFAVAQVAGIPVGLYLANNWGWEAPFLMIVGISVLTVLTIIKFMQPVAKHMEMKANVNPVNHLVNTVTNGNYWLPYVTTALLSIGGFMMMPFSTPFIINNLEISQRDLPLIYVITGIASMVLMPLIGKLSDKFGKFPTFVFGSVVAIVMIIVFTHLPPVPVWQLVAVNVLMFTGIMSRMIPSQALMTAIPKMEDRGAFMSVNSSLQQVAGGVASFIAGLIIVQQANGKLLHFDTLGFICCGVIVVCASLVYIISKRVAKKLHHAQPARYPAEAVETVNV
jgi:predicted MFS family arabinose efflux permease